MFLIVRQVLAQPQITEQSIYGVLSAYMIIGLIFSAVYVAMWKFGGASSSSHGEADNTKTFQYFSFTTLTTLGYGDFTAAGDGGRAVAVLEAMAGQMFLATLVARLVAGFRWSDRAAARRGRRQAAPAAGQDPQVSGTGPTGIPARQRPCRLVRRPRPPAGILRRPPRPVPGEEGLGTRPDPAEPARARCGDAEPASAPARGRGPGGQARSPPPAPRSGIEPGGPEHRVSGGPRAAPGVRFPSPPRRAWPARR